MSTEDNVDFSNSLPDHFTDATQARFWRCPLGPGSTLHSFDTRTNTLATIKCIDLEDTSDKKSFLTFQSAIWNKLMKSQHRFVLPYDGGISVTGIWLAFHQRNELDILDFWEDTQSTDRRMLVILEMLVSVNALHKSGLVHGDLNVNNLLVHLDNSSVCCALDGLLLSACRIGGIVDSNDFVDSRFRDASNQVVSTLQDEYALGMICELLLQQSPDFEKPDKDLLAEISSTLKSTNYDGKSSRLSTCIKMLLARCKAATLNAESTKFETPGFWDETLSVNDGTSNASVRHAITDESDEAVAQSLVSRREATDIHPQVFTKPNYKTKILTSAIVGVIVAIGATVSLTQNTARNKASDVPKVEAPVVQSNLEESSESTTKPESLPVKPPEATKDIPDLTESKAVPTPPVVPNLIKQVDSAVSDAKSSVAEAIRASSSCEVTLNRMTTEIVRDTSTDYLFTKLTTHLSDAKDFTTAANNCYKDTDRAAKVVKSSAGKNVQSAAKFARTYADRAKYLAKKAQSASYEATAVLKQALEKKSSDTSSP